MTGKKPVPTALECAKKVLALPTEKRKFVEWDCVLDDLVNEYEELFVDAIGAVENDYSAQNVMKMGKPPRWSWRPGKGFFIESKEWDASPKKPNVKKKNKTK